MSEKVTKLALASRLIVLTLQLLGNSLLPDHRPDVFRAANKWADYALQYNSNIDNNMNNIDNNMNNIDNNMNNIDNNMNNIDNNMNNIDESIKDIVDKHIPRIINDNVDNNIAVNIDNNIDHNIDNVMNNNIAKNMHNKLNQTKQPTWLDKLLHFCLGGLRHWDGEYFLHIAEYTYSFENTLAFQPLYPLLVRLGTQTLKHLTPATWLSLRSLNLLLAIALNLYFFCRAANALYALTQRLFGDFNKSWNAALLFCLNPAAIFFTAAYSESLYCWLSLALMLECVGEARVIRTTSALALSIVCRSNGLINAGFPAWFALRAFVLKPTQPLRALFKLIFSLLVALLPLSFFYFYAFKKFCLTAAEETHAPEVLALAHERNYILAGARQPPNSPWCTQTLPYPYAYIQSHYWQVGFMRYYVWRQLPNFVLAFPILAFLYYHCYRFFRHFFRSLLPKYPLRQLIIEYKSFPFVAHAFFLTLFCTFFVHIQVSTRLLCSASPCVYWFGADYLPKSFGQLQMRSKAGFILLWFGCYFVLGTVMFSNNLPWT